MKKTLKRAAKNIIKALTPSRSYLLILNSYNSQKTLKGNSKLRKVRYKNKSRIADTISEFSTSSIALDNLDLVVNTLEEADIDYFLIPGFSPVRYRIGVHENDTSKVIDVLCRQHSLSGAYIYIKRKFYSSTLLLCENLIPKLTRGSYNFIRIFQYKCSSSGEVYANDGYGCDIEFWKDGEHLANSNHSSKEMAKLNLSTYPKYNFSNTLISPRRNPVTPILHKEDRIPQLKTINKRKYSTYQIFSKTLLNDLNFPIDVVYTWVDNSDPKWINKYNQHKINIGDNKLNNTASRYTNRDELKYSLRSLHMYGSSFIRNIYIITDNQKPEWIKETSNLKIVNHSQIFKNKDSLPVFNSHAIESQIHNVPGLSERYIYFNDDMMLGRHTDGSIFFHPNGISKIQLSKALIGAGEPNNEEPAPSSAGKNVRNIIEDAFNITITNKLKHSPVPLIKSVAKEVEENYREVINKTQSSRFRSHEDVSSTSLLQPSYALASGRAVADNMRLSVVDISTPNAPDQLHNLLKSKKAYTICLNESETPESRQEEVNSTVRNFLESYYPFRSPWEKT